MKTNKLIKKKPHDKCIYYSYSTLYDLLRRRKALDVETSGAELHHTLQREDQWE